MAITLADALSLLNLCTRSELRDHAFGDREVTWTDAAGNGVGFYCNSGKPPHHVYITRFDGNGDEVESAEFPATSQMMQTGMVCIIERNDSTGPDNYQDGACMPGLTLAGVKEELCTPPADLELLRTRDDAIEEDPDNAGYQEDDWEDDQHDDEYW